ncbi:MAG: hypothetical protein RL110_730 [Bacteroidota bacterium]
MNSSNGESKPLQILNASAGSGKTYRLVLEYLGLLFKPSADPKVFKSIMGMTFTNKAAYELKDRILLALFEISNYNPAPEKKRVADLIQRLSELSNVEPETLPKRAQKALSEILHNYEDFSISTIDKFNLRLIRAFSRDLNLTHEMEVIMNEKEIIELVIDSVFAKLGTKGHEALTQLVLNYSTMRLEEEHHWNFKKQLIEFCDVLTKERYKTTVDQLLERNYAEHDLRTKKNEQRQLIETLIHKAKSIQDSFREHHLESKHLFNGSKSYNFLDRIGELSNWPEAFKDGGLKKHLANSKFDGVLSEGLIGELNSLYEFHEKNHEKYYQIQFYCDTFYNLLLLQFIAREMEEVRKRSQFIRISEFNTFISALVQHQTAPYIYERLGNRYHHYLLDEFQDTSRMQWQNLIPLVEESLSKGKKTLIVGDAKQSIYRFNNGLAEQFVELPSIYNPEKCPRTERISAFFKSQGHKSSLLENHRSGKEIVAFNNQFFLGLRDSLSPEGQRFYDSINQTPTKSFEGYVRLFSKEDKKKEVDVHAKILEFIHECLADGFKPGDICILCNRNKDGNKIAEFLSNEGFKVVSSDSLLVDANEKIRLVIQYLKIRNKTSNLNEIKKFANFYLNLTQEESVAAYQKLFKTNDKGYRYFDDLAFIDAYFDQVSSFYCPYSSVYDLIGQFYKLMNWVETEDVYLHFLLDYSFVFQSNKRPDLSNFLNQYEDKKDQLSVQFPKTDDALQIMTIHKSKGLQFPVVIIPHMDYSLSDTMNYHLMEDGDQIYYRKLSKESPLSFIRAFTAQEAEKHYLDQINKIYVAFTRPVGRFYGINAFKNGLGVHLHATLCEAFPEAVEDGLIELRFGDKNWIPESKSTDNYYEIDAPKEFLWYPKLVVKDANAEKNGANFGKIFHETLAHCSNGNEASEYLLRKFAENSISTEELEKLQESVLLLLTNPQYLEWQGSATVIRNEAWIMTDEQNLLRPDKIFELEEVVVIIDFKTGELKEQDHQQLKRYVELLKAIYGASRSIESYLYYTYNSSFIRCD